MIVEPVWKSLLTDEERRELRPALPAEMPRRPDVIIVGGGLVGLSAAYFLADRGAGRILVLDQNDLSSGASGANGGGVFPGPMRADFPAAYRALALESREILADWATRGWADFDWRRNGLLWLNPGTLSVPPTEQACCQRELRRDAEYVSGAELREIEPELSPEFDEGLFYRDDGQLNPLRLALCLARVLRHRGVVLGGGVRVRKLTEVGGRITRVETTAEPVVPGSVILATGWSARQLTRPLGVDFPLEPAKGQLLATPPLDWRLQTNLGGWQLVRQLPTGEIIAGGTVEFVGQDEKPTAENTRQITALARRTLPRLEKVEFTRVWTGLRPYTPDERPVIDRLPGIENGFVAAGHFTKGVLMAPVTGALLAEWLTEGRPARDVSPFALTRFISARR